MKMNRYAAHATSVAASSQRSAFWHRLLQKKALLYLLLFTLIIFLKVWQTVTVDHLNRRNGLWRDELKAVQNENLLLKAKIEALRSRERITRLGREELNMVEVPKIILQDKSSFEKLTDQFEKAARHSGQR
jgi:hypothetical protein